jgi:predicted dehydrogenase
MAASVAEAEEIAGAAGSLHAAIGLQGRSNPAVRRAAERAGTYHTPGVEHALHNARLIEAVRRAAERGERQTMPEAA